MTEKTEKKFFETFDILPKVETWHLGLTIKGKNCCEFCSKEKCDAIYSCNEPFIIYPEITEHLLLKLICLLTQYNMGFFDHIGSVTIEPYSILNWNIDELQEQVLKDVVNKFLTLEKQEWKEQFKQQIKQIFCEVEE